MEDAAVCHRVRASNTVKVGPYILKKVIGRGNFAVVKLGKHEVTKTKVAVKIVDKCRIDEDNLLKIYREIQILKALRHPNVVRLYQVMETDTKLYLVTEFASGGEVFEHLYKHGRKNERQARRIFRQTVAAIAYCHMSGIVHRDLKAENLLLDADNNVKLVDFGFSNFYNSGQLLSTWCGSPPYAAPELFLGENYDGTKADVWSLGVVLYILVSGGFPFPSNSIERLKQAVLSGHFNIPFYVSVECADLIRKMLIVDPAQRIGVRQIVQHKWFYADDWNDRWQALFNESLSPKIVGPAEVIDLNPAVIIFMQQKGYNADRVAEAVFEKRFDEEYAAYHLLYDKLLSDKCTFSQLRSDVAEAHGDLPRRGSRGSLTTGQATREPVSETNTILASDLVKLSVASLDQGSHTSDSDEGSSGETSPDNLHAYLAQRRHTALGVPGLTTAGVFPAPTTLATASGHIGVPFPLAFGLGEVSNLAVPHCALPALLRPDLSRTSTHASNGRRGSDGATGLPQGLQFPEPGAFGSAMSATPFFGPVLITPGNHMDPSSTSPFHQRLPPQCSNLLSVGSNDVNSGDESVEEAGARYLRARSSTKRHTIHGQLSTGMVTNPAAASNCSNTGVGFARQCSPILSGHHPSRHTSRGEPYRPLSSHRRASDTAQVTPSLLTHLEKLYYQAIHRPESPVCGENSMRQLQQEFQQLRANAELTQQQLLQSNGSDQPRRSPRSSPPGQSLDMIVEHDAETSGYTGIPSMTGRNSMGRMNEMDEQQLSMPQINVTDDRGTIVVHRPPNAMLPPAVVSPMVQNELFGGGLHGVTSERAGVMPPTVADPITNFQYFAQGLLGGGGGNAAMTPANQQHVFDNVLLQQQRYMESAASSEFYQTPNQADNLYSMLQMYYNSAAQEPQQQNYSQTPVINTTGYHSLVNERGSTSGNTEESIVLPPTRSVSGIVCDVKRALDILNVTYWDTDSALKAGGNNVEQHSVRRVSLESGDGTRMEIGVAQLDNQTGYNKVDFRCIGGDYNRYKQLCRELVSALRL